MEKHKWPPARKRTYVAYVMPVGYPDTSSICTHCDNPGVLWLEESELIAYQNGERVFRGPGNFTRMKADDRRLHKHK